MEGSGSQFKEIGAEEAVIEIYKVNGIEASSWVDLPPKYINIQSIINIKNEGQLGFFMVYPGSSSPG